MTHSQAIERCKSLGGRLAEEENWEMFHEFKEIFESSSKKHTFWIGLSKCSEDGQLYWIERDEPVIDIRIEDGKFIHSAI